MKGEILRQEGKVHRGKVPISEILVQKYSCHETIHNARELAQTPCFSHNGRTDAGMFLLILCHTSTWEKMPG